MCVPFMCFYVSALTILWEHGAFWMQPCAAAPCTLTTQQRWRGARAVIKKYGT
ncbi:Hypothetical protein Cul210932_0085 [Corynebacterium ulcerans]|uniref:Uncharacterized protein n=1 Tax=Corynebacterium ulcerans FRC58 TaxID=1408268 RepID=A0ABN4GQJ3_CORUL|nr:Hypothetical protein Cul210932_0085 [Corynebacterium ulcerans]AIU90684.1 Hypothetical protein Cul05146_0079 [Corynebacterium ulcerans]AKA95638.1 Hypothetical protein CUL131002_0078c [Corynebacterium ulcerans]AKN75930.1 Hypothetical protein CulFRC58_0076 [Corynebacterium ulcerans FRC58]ALD93826.1 Hypothetical protein Cul131001_0086 [Corynebacterium ulcerans]